MPLTHARRILLLRTVLAVALLLTGLFAVDTGPWRTLLIAAGVVVALSAVPALLAQGRDGEH